MTPRWGHAVQKAATCLETNEWEVFAALDEDFTGTVSTAVLKARFVEILRAKGTSLSEKELDDFFASVDADRNGYIDHAEWTTMVELIKRKASGSCTAKSAGNPRGTRKVLRPGSIVRDGAAMDTEKITKLRTGTLVAVLEEATLDDGTRRLHVDWGERPMSGWVSAKTTTRVATAIDTTGIAATLAGLAPGPSRSGARVSGGGAGQPLPPLPARARRPSVAELPAQLARQPSARWEDWLDEAAAKPREANAAAERRHDLETGLKGNAKFFDRFSEPRKNFLLQKLDCVTAPDSPSTPLSGDDAALSPKGRLRFFSRKVDDDALSAGQRARLREGLLGVEGVAWRRAQERRGHPARMVNALRTQTLNT